MVISVDWDTRRLVQGSKRIAVKFLIIPFMLFTLHETRQGLYQCELIFLK